MLRSFQLTVDTGGTVMAGIDVDAAEGRADSGFLPDDLTDLVVALGEAAAEHGRGILFALDEVQFLEAAELEALIAALHRSVQLQLPVTLVAAGLPQLPRLAGEAKSYAERLFRFPMIGRLEREPAIEALVAPARDLGVEVEPQAAAEVFRLTDGYPYFIQEYGKAIWDMTAEAPIRRADVNAARDVVEAKLDESFFRTRVERATDLELALPARDGDAGAGAAERRRSRRRARSQLRAARDDARAAGRQGPALHAPSRIRRVHGPPVRSLPAAGVRMSEQPDTLLPHPVAGDAFEGEVRIENVRWSSDDGGFAVVDVSLEDGSPLAVVGPLGHLEEGSRARISGRYEEHATHGLQLRALEAEPIDPTGAEGARYYLRTIPGIGAARAARLVETHGDAVFEVIDADPEAAFGAVPGLGSEKARVAAQAWVERRSQRRLYALLAPHGLARYTAEIIATHGERAVEAVTEDPYSLTSLHGVGFHTADRFALALGVDPSAPERQQAAALHALAEAEQNGHTHLPLAELLAAMRALLGPETEPSIGRVTSTPGITVEGTLIYRDWTYESERWLGATLGGDGALEGRLEPGARGRRSRRADARAERRGRQRAEPAPVAGDGRAGHRQDAPHPFDRSAGRGAEAEAGPAGADGACRAAADAGDRRLSGADDPSGARVDPRRLPGP